MVLGAHVEAIAIELAANACDVVTVFNERWKEGMHTSIACGIQALEEQSDDSGGVILMNCDQPAISPETLQNLASAFRSKAPPAVASRYDRTLGTPALFSRELFQRLKELNDGGAKSLLNELGSGVLACDFPRGEIDVDTSADYAKWIGLRADSKKCVGIYDLKQFTRQFRNAKPRIHKTV